jgi:hypothetical protein
MSPHCPQSSPRTRLTRARAAVWLPLIALVLGSAPAWAEAPVGEPGALPVPGAPADDLWQRARDLAGDWWQRSGELADQAIEGAGGLMGEEPRDFDRVWREVVPTLDETLTLTERQSELPKSAWLGPDQASNQADIEALLDDAVEILSASPVQRFRDRIRAIQGQVLRARAEIAEYRQRRVSAPTTGALKRTVSDFDRLIAEREADIERLEDEQVQVRKEFAQSVRELGVDLSDEQVEFLLSTVVGDNMVDLGILFDNVRSVTVQLEGLVAESGEDLANARRYYGMYVVLLRALRRMHLRIEEAIGEQYVPQIDGIIARARSLMAETRRLQRASPSKRELLAANLEAQQLTIDAAAVYRQYLGEQRSQVAMARAELDKDIAAAWNTYETVRVSGELVGLVRSSQQLLEGLMNRQVPALRPFENLEMQREFQKLTEQLRQANPS